MNPVTHTLTRRAVVLGASMGGLLAARALSETFDQVTVIDRDDVSGTGVRKGVPQGLHAHGLLSRGREVLEELFPGLTDELSQVGAMPGDIANDLTWYSGSRPLRRTPSDLVGLFVSRPALEDYLRGRVRLLPNVEIVGGTEAVRLLSNDDHSVVTGVEVVRLADNTRDELTADLVVDSTGRGNRGPTWLAELGYDAPIEDSVEAGIAYATREYVRQPLPSGSAAIVTALSPDCLRGAVLLPLEGDRWVLTLVGMADDIPPTDVDGFEAYARSLPIDDLHHVIDHAQPLTDPRRFRVPASVRRRYEKLRRLPRGYLTFADALCAFNPVYGQGMTVAAVEAIVLRDCVREPGNDLPRQFYRRTAKVLDIPWDMAVGGDLALPTVKGERTAKIRFLNAYIAKVLRAGSTDPKVALAFLQIINLASRPERLFAPAILARVLTARPAPAPAPNRTPSPTPH